MISLETQHFRLNRYLLLAIGLWPHRTSKFAQVQFFVFFSILITFITFQFTTFVTSDCTINFIIKVLSSMFFFICLAIKYNSFWVNADIVRLSLEQIQHTCNDIENRNEIAIIEKYGNTAKLQTTVLIIFGACGILIFTILPIWPRIVGMMLPINNSRPRSAIQFATEYFVDQEKYYYLIIFHASAATCIGTIAMIATGTTLLVYFKHICGMFSIASFRIEKAMMTNILQNVTQEKEILIYRGIVYAIDIHRKATEFSQVLVKSFEGSFFFLIVAGLVCLSSTFVRIATIDNFEELLLPSVMVCALYVYMLISNYTAQEIIDHNNHVFATVYNVQWYVAPLRIQKMLLFLLQRGNKAFNLNLGGLFVGSLESAAMLTSASISYFTVLYSTQN